LRPPFVVINGSTLMTVALYDALKALFTTRMNPNSLSAFQSEMKSLLCDRQLIDYFLRRVAAAKPGKPGAQQTLHEVLRQLEPVTGGHLALAGQGTT